MKFALIGGFLALSSLSSAVVFLGSDFVGTSSRPNHDAALAAFLSASGAVGSYGFEGASNGPINANVSFGPVTGSVVSGSGPGVTNADVDDNGLYGTFAFGGTKDFVALADAGVTILTITFNTPVKAFGVSISDIGDGAPAVPPAHEFVFNNGETYRILPANSAALGNGSAAFWGVTTNTSFTSVTLRYASDGVGTGPGADGIGLDNIRVAAVPEPATLTALGLGILAVCRRKQKKQ